MFSVCLDAPRPRLRSGGWPYRLAPVVTVDWGNLGLPCPKRQRPAGRSPPKTVPGAPTGEDFVRQTVEHVGALAAPRPSPRRDRRRARTSSARLGHRKPESPERAREGEAPCRASRALRLREGAGRRPQFARVGLEHAVAKTRAAVRAPTSTTASAKDSLEGISGRSALAPAQAPRSDEGVTVKKRLALSILDDTLQINGCTCECKGSVAPGSRLGTWVRFRSSRTSKGTNARNRCARPGECIPRVAGA